jgi:rubrerythrin
LTVAVHDRALAGQYDTVGQSHLALDPRQFGDLLTHDVWMDLDSEGRILVRVSMEDEKDDIQFYFGRAFRSLKRAESDMLRIFIDKVRCISFFAANSI